MAATILSAKALTDELERHNHLVLTLHSNGPLQNYTVGPTGRLDAVVCVWIMWIYVDWPLFSSRVGSGATAWYCRVPMWRPISRPIMCSVTDRGFKGLGFKMFRFRVLKCFRLYRFRAWCIQKTVFG